jgi:hypothetical protein
MGGQGSDTVSSVALIELLQSECRVKDPAALWMRMTGSVKSDRPKP